MTHILVIRLSAMGDVALLTPVVRALAEGNSDLQITILTRPKWSWFFDNIANTKVFPADLDADYKGFYGLWRLFRALRAERFDAVVDIHDNLRSRILGILFRLSGTKVVVFDKGRAEKRAFTRRNDKIRAVLPHTTERYAAAFAEIGLPRSQKPFSTPCTPVFAWLSPEKTEKPEKQTKKHKIGIAPFAKHLNKQWGLSQIAEFIHIYIARQPESHILLFGGGADEQAQLEILQKQFPKHSTVVAGKYSLAAEIELMQTLRFMLCMDSSNLHLAALAGVPTVSIWGATHPDVGFAPYGLPEKNLIIQTSTDDLPCRPCSVFGDKPCFRGDRMCMQSLQPVAVADRVAAFLSTLP